MERLLNLSKRGQFIAAITIISFFLAISLFVVSEVYFKFSDKAISATQTISIATIPTLVSLILIFLKEKTEDLFAIDQNINILIDKTIPETIGKRFLANLSAPTLTIRLI